MAAESNNRPNGGAIRVATPVIDALIEANDPIQILTYLVLARHTDAMGELSTAGRSAVKKNLGMGDKQADLALESVLALRDRSGRRLAYRSAEWSLMTGSTYERESFRAQVRFVIPQGDPDEYTWIGNGLVDGYGRFKQPLVKLKRLGILAIRTMLILYAKNNMQQFGGVEPMTCRKSYEARDTGKRFDGYGLWHCIPGHRIKVGRNLVLPVLALNKWGDEEQEKFDGLLQDSIMGLAAAGFIYEVVTVLDSSALHMANVIYELDTKSKHGYKPIGENGLSGKTARLAGYVGASVANKAGRFDGVYAAVLEFGVKPVFVGIFRLRFRVVNPKNYSVSEAFSRIYNSQNEWSDVLDGLLAVHENDSLSSGRGK